MNHCIDRLPEDRMYTAGVANYIINPANDHFASAFGDSFSAELDMTLDDFSSSSNVFCVSSTTGSKSLETRLIGIGYDFFLGHINIWSIYPFITHNF